MKNRKQKTENKTDKKIIIKGAKENNLKNIDVSIPLQKLVCVSGVSGSGKSTLIIDILGRALTKHFYRSKMSQVNTKQSRVLKY
jgi:excinuclease ABC subunit A